jgi:hypothetical protein
MDLFTREDLKVLLAKHPSPCLSLFLRTHRGGAEDDPIRWRSRPFSAIPRPSTANVGDCSVCYTTTKRAASVSRLTPAARQS